MKFFTQTTFRDHTNNSARCYHLTLVCLSQLVWGRRGGGGGDRGGDQGGMREAAVFNSISEWFWWKWKSNTGPTDRNAEWKKYSHSSFSVWFVEKQRLKATQNTAMTAAILCFALCLWHHEQGGMYGRRVNYISVHHSQRTTHMAVPWGSTNLKEKDYFCCTHFDRKTMWSLHIKIFSHLKAKLSIA